jgi:hypothetical protein
MASEGGGQEKRRMVDYDEHGQEIGEGPVIVKRSVYEAARRFEKTAKPEDGPPFEVARQRSMEYRKAGKAATAARWHDIYNFLMWREGVSADTPTVIVEPVKRVGGQTGADAGRNRRRRSGKANR